MILVNPSVEIIPQEYSRNGIFKHIELCGRVSYKSEGNITEDSANEFVGRRIQDGHTAILEQATVCLEFPHLNIKDYATKEFAINPKVLRYIDNPYSKVFINDSVSYITTNYRVLYEKGWLDDLYNMCSPRAQHPKRCTVKFICSRAIANELVRHRVFSFVQESSRFCNYSKGKFGNQITYIIPSWATKTEEYEHNYGIPGISEAIVKPKDEDVYKIYYDFYYSLADAETAYLNLINNQGFKAEQARDVLPLATKTELYMTGFVEDWLEFFKLRTAPNAHPDMRQLANELKKKFTDNILN